MDKKLIAVMVLILVLAVGGGGYLLLRNQQKPETANDTMPTMNTRTNNGTSTGNKAAVATDKVTIANFAFSPADITVKKGTKVTWTNNDTTAHTVTESDGKSGPDSATIDPGSTYSFTFDQTGTYQYHCSIHPSMTGSVTVSE